MMSLNIIVLIKSVPDPKTPPTLKVDGSLDLKNVKIVVNPIDKYAVEAALQLKERYGGKIIGLSLGDHDNIDIFREIIAMGVDSFIYIKDPDYQRFDTLQKSYVLSRAVKKIEKDLGRVDIVLCGVESSDTNMGVLASQIGEWLEIPSISYVDKILEIKNGSIIVKKIIEDGFITLRSRMPVVLSIADTGYEPRIPSLRDTIMARRREIPIWKTSDLSLEFRETVLKTVRFKQIESKRLGKIFRDEDVDKMIDRFFEELKRDGVSLLR